MDINLPGISGIEALRILGEDPATAHIPVVALSANAMPRDIEKGLQAEFFRYLNQSRSMTTRGRSRQMNRDEGHGQPGRHSERQNPGR
jgi:DNA-binding NarL/FixJ family response regulator